MSWVSPDPVNIDIIAMYRDPSIYLVTMLEPAVQQELEGFALDSGMLACNANYAQGLYIEIGIQDMI